MNNKYNDSIDIDELNLFIKYNNNKERGSRHIDAFLIEPAKMTPAEVEKFSQVNASNLIRDMKKQIANNPEQFK